MNENCYKNQIQKGQQVEIILKQDQKTGNITKGMVKRVLTKSNYHSRGIKVMLEDGRVGRVKTIIV